MSETTVGEDDDAKSKELLEAIEAARGQGRHDEVQRLGMELMALAAEHAASHPSADLDLNMEAHRLEMQGDWAGAEAAYLKVLELAELPQADALPWQVDAKIYQAHRDLARLHGVLNHKDLACDHLQGATRWARKADLTPLMLSALELHADAARQRGETTTARALVDEAVRLLDDENGRTSDLMRARIMVVRSLLLIDFGDLAGAESDLWVAKDILQPQFGSLFMAGVHSGLARWWRATASLRAERGDVSGSLSAWRESVERRRHVATLPQLEGPYKYLYLAGSLLNMAAELGKAGYAEEADDKRSEGEEIYRHFKLAVPEVRE